MKSMKMMKCALLAGVAAIVATPGPVFAKAPTNTELEARVKTLEKMLADVKTELEAARADRETAKTDIIQLKKSNEDVGKRLPSGDGFKVGDTTLKFGGYVKAEALVSDYGDGDTAAGVGRDFYVPGSIPVGASASGESTDFDAHAKQTRLTFTASRAIEGHKTGAYIEADFQSADAAGNERVTNAYNFGVRRAYITFDNWLFGQEWTTFQNVGALPETTDFIGPTEGTTFARQAMIRYTHKINDRASLMFALENPETAYLSGTTMTPADDDSAPDVAIRLNYKTKGGSEFVLSGLGRRLSVETTTAPAFSEEAFGWGVSGSGKIPIGKKDDLRFMATYGDGIGRYVGVNFAPDVAVVTTAGAQQFETLALVAGFAAYRHFWTDKTRSTIMGGYQSVDNDKALFTAGQLDVLNEQAWSGAVNLFTSPVKGLDLGVEYRHAEREVASGLEGSMDRLHFVAKQSF